MTMTPNPSSNPNSKSKWIVDGLIPKGHDVLIIGKPQNGKSWLVNELAVAVASGTKFMGEFDTTHDSDVILIDDDSQSSTMQRRIERLSKGRNFPVDKLRLTLFSHGTAFEPKSGRYIPTELNTDFILWDPSHREWLKNEIRKMNNPVVIIDSFLKVMPAMNTNRTDHAMKGASYWRDIRSAGATVILIHHSTLKKDKDSVNGAIDFDPSRDVLGSTMLVANSDTMLFAYRVPVDTTTEFIVKPFGRREKLEVNPFACELQEDKTMEWARFEILGEPTTLPSDHAMFLFPLFYSDDEKREGLTVINVLKTIGRALDEKEIRKALKELEFEGVLTRGVQKHNRFLYKIDPTFESGFDISTSYKEALCTEFGIY